MNARRLTSVAVIAWCLVVASVAGSTNAAAASEADARPVNEFLDSLGVNVHLHYDETPYVTRFDDVIRPRLRQLGFRHVRDGLYTYPAASADDPYYQRVRALVSDGMRFSLIAGMETPGGIARTDMSLVDDAMAWSGGGVVALEGVNEPDVQQVPDWVAAARSVQSDLWQTVRANPDLSSVKVYGPSGMWSPEAYGDQSAEMDFGNIHPYPGGNCPTCPNPYGTSVDSVLASYRSVSRDDRLVATETGYHNAINIAGGSHRPASEAAAARYLPRLLFEYFNRGISRTYLYELIDPVDDPSRTVWDQNFGLLRNDGSPKPAFNNLANLTSILRSMGSGPRKPFAYTLSAPETVHHTILSTSDGVVLALWNEVPSWDNGERLNQADDVGARRDLTVPTPTAQLRLDLPARYRLYDPATSQTSIDEGAGDIIDLEVTDSVRLVRLSPIPTIPVPPEMSAAPDVPPAAPAPSGATTEAPSAAATGTVSAPTTSPGKSAAIGEKAGGGVASSSASAERRFDAEASSESSRGATSLLALFGVLVPMLALRSATKYYRRRGRTHS